KPRVANEMSAPWVTNNIPGALLVTQGGARECVLTLGFGLKPLRGKYQNRALACASARSSVFCSVF
ncbi:MAG: hypothetical protein L0241_31075, partial [Planctomycetia bacterium]|nr:hypothetical protein [Planctomycetia bacterium]